MITPAEWKRAAIGFGLAAVGAYLVVALRLLPVPLLRVLFISAGPLIAVAILAMGQWLAAERDSVALRLAVLLHVVAAAFFSAMAIVQNANLAFTRSRLARTDDELERRMIEAAHRSVDGVQLGLDIAWDIWITAGAVFLAVALLRHPRFPAVIGWTGIAAAALVLALNLWTFPVPPASAGLFDAGPILGLWYLAVILTAGLRRGAAPVRAAAPAPPATR